MSEELEREAAGQDMAVKVSISKVNDYGTAAHYLSVKSVKEPAKDLLCGTADGYCMLSEESRRRPEVDAFLWDDLLGGDFGFDQLELEEIGAGDNLLEQRVDEWAPLYGLFKELEQRLRLAWSSAKQAPDQGAKGHGVRKEVVITVQATPREEVRNTYHVGVESSQQHIRHGR